MAGTDERSRRAPAGARKVTDDESEFYERNGWVKLDGFVDPELAAEMLRVGQAKIDEARTTQNIWNTAWNFARDGVEPFRSLVLSETMGLNARKLINRQRLTDREIPIRFNSDLIACKLDDAVATHRHHDGYNRCSDRSGPLTFWIALDEVTPEMGAMQFLSGSHREGPLGVVEQDEDLVEDYPKLLDLYELSPPLHYQPGDATAHHTWTIHGAPRNTTGRPRWSYLFGYQPADVLRHAQVPERVDDEDNPIVYPGSSR
jgi:ectoine hydroxylase-related dioxygenase (phytanoyl-CoA dioxygenase family)